LGEDMKKSQIPWERKSIWRFLGFVPKNQKMRLITKWNNRMNKYYKNYPNIRRNKYA